MADQTLPATLRDWMRDRQWGAHHLRWHAERQWDRLSPSARGQLAARGWSRASRQEGASGNGRDFLFMHRAMIHVLREQFPEHSDLFAGWERPPTDPDDPGDPVPAASLMPGPFRPAMQRAIDRLTSDLASFSSEDELGLYIETNLRPTPGNPVGFSSDPTTGIHNYLHGRFTDGASPVNLGDPSVNLENTRFWKLHGWIDTCWSAYRRLKGLSDSAADYAALLQAEQDAMRNPQGHHPETHLEAAALVAAPQSMAALPAEVRQPFRESTAWRVQRLLASTPAIETRDELIDYLQTAIQIEHATLPLYLTAMWSLKDDSGEHYGILRDISMQEMLHLGIVCNLLKSIGARPSIVPPLATIPVFPGQLPGLDLSDFEPGDISLEAFSTFGTDPKRRIRLFMRIEEPEGGDIDHAALETVPRFHTIGEFYDVIARGIQTLSASGDITFATAGQVEAFGEMTPIATASDAVRQIRLIQQQGEGTAATQVSGTADKELAHYYRFKQIVEEKKYSWATGRPVLDPGLPLPFPGPDQVRPFRPAPLEGHPQSAEFDATYSRMLDGLQGAWDGRPAALDDAVGAMYEMTDQARSLMDTGFGPNFRYVTSRS